VPGLVLVDPQQYGDQGLILPRVAVGEPAWVAVYGDQEGSRTVEPIGLLALDAGYYTDVDIELEQSLTAGDTVYIVLHQDSGVVGEFEPSEFDFTLKSRGIDFSTKLVLR